MIIMFTSKTTKKVREPKIGVLIKYSIRKEKKSIEISKCKTNLYPTGTPFTQA